MWWTFQSAQASILPLLQFGVGQCVSYIGWARLVHNIEIILLEPKSLFLESGRSGFTLKLCLVDMFWRSVICCHFKTTFGGNVRIRIELLIIFPCDPTFVHHRWGTCYPMLSADKNRRRVSRSILHFESTRTDQLRLSCSHGLLEWMMEWPFVAVISVESDVLPR